MDANLKRKLHRRAVKATSKKVRLDLLNAVLEGHIHDTEEPQDQFIHAEVFNFDPVELQVDRSNDDSGDADPDGATDVGFNGVDSADLSGSDQATEVDRGNGSESVHSEVSESDDSDGSDDNNCVQLNNDREKEQYVIDSVREWAQQPGQLSMSKLEDLLHRLSVVFPNTPLTYTTLFHCDYEFDISEFASGGTFWYKGFKNYLEQLNLREYLETYSEIVVDVGIDGLPLDRVKLWPILGSLVGSENEPFIIAVYRGYADPTDVDEFMSKFKEEVADLILNGFEFGGNVYKGVIRYSILDAPARQFLKCLTGHGG
ncbi:GTP cyclohydrolase FolE2 [Frankliniella fusca]|uniref:GTP cyclohydrolase FolE2 n=1 Tax=Frankliniella fusca TaxID=407009 RepID=A0AAE1GWU6_9NEOP|nr:GTP cyclohydrolase FolE2 [Frankliniella fusca]